MLGFFSRNFICSVICTDCGAFWVAMAFPEGPPTVSAFRSALLWRSEAAKARLEISNSAARGTMRCMVAPPWLCEMFRERHEEIMPGSRVASSARTCGQILAFEAFDAVKRPLSRKTNEKEHELRMLSFRKKTNAAEAMRIG